MSTFLCLIRYLTKKEEVDTKFSKRKVMYFQRSKMYAACKFCSYQCCVLFSPILIYLSGRSPASNVREKKLRPLVLWLGDNNNVNPNGFSYLMQLAQNIWRKTIIIKEAHTGATSLMWRPLWWNLYCCFFCQAMNCRTLLCFYAWGF